MRYAIILLSGFFCTTCRATFVDTRGPPSNECNAGALCQSCNTAADCDIGPCVSEHCTNTTECRSDADCDPRQFGYDSCNACTTGGECAVGSCVNRGCAFTTQTCTSQICSTNADCTAPGDACISGICQNATGYDEGDGCNPGASNAQVLCGPGLVCEPGGNTCEQCRAIPCPESAPWNSHMCACEPSTCVQDADCSISAVLYSGCVGAKGSGYLYAVCNQGACDFAENTCQ